MPKKKPGMTPEEQSEQFKREAQKLIDAGEFSPTEAAAALDEVVRRTSFVSRTKGREVGN